ncbi:DUF6092 family protein [Bacillus sp. FJAT-29814]|uniref:DUF6092 family protein n=1 Tax=Bacillus sp. FJAT-29814 TaxID=1729688 RepID=UPI00082DFC09|nr:DUF6092 family protein [Bacillus sp. FJAT-29814]
MTTTETTKAMALQEHLRDYVAYTLTSAKGLYREPLSYGPMRMIDSMERALRLLQEAGIKDDALEAGLESLRKERWRAMNDPEGFAKAIDGAVLNLVELTIK